MYGTIEIIADFVETGKSLLIMGRPGIGKTTMLREAARVLADDLDKRVVVVDTSNEIAGDGDIPHPAIGKARRMQVRTPSLQHEVMIEAVENHMPQVIVIDEIGTELEAQAARTIAERGVQLIGTAHGNTLDNLMLNPTLSDLIGGIQTVTLGDEEARRRRTQKSVLERKAPPTFDVIIEIQDRERVLVHADVADTVDAMLRGDPTAPELRWRDEEGVHRSAVAAAALAPGAARPGPVLRAHRVGHRRGGPSRAGGATRASVAARASSRRATAGRGPGSDRERQGRGGPAGRRIRMADGPGGAGPGATRVEVPFVAGEIADRGPVERGTAPAPEPPARVARELSRQREWRESASKAIDTLKADEGTGPVNVADLAADDEALMDRAVGAAVGRGGTGAACPGRRRAADAARAAPGHQPEAARAGHPRAAAPGDRGPGRRRGRRRHDDPERVQAEDADGPRGRGSGHADLRPQDEHDPADAVVADLDLRARDRPAGRGAPRDGGRDRAGAQPRPRPSSSRRRTRTSGASSTRWPSGPISCLAPVAASPTAAYASTRTRRRPPGADLARADLAVLCQMH